MQILLRWSLPVLLMLGCLGSHAENASFYKDEQGLFSTRPAADKRMVNLTRFGPVGLSIDLMQPAFTMMISGVEPGSPAAKTGKLKKGQIILTINGEPLKDIDPRIQLGNLITEAEASDGKLVLHGYGGLALCEYYLRTGDEQVLPTIQKMADKLVEMENFGGWAERGPTAALTYGGGGGHLNAAGTLCLGYLMLAVECGAKVPEDTLQRVLERFYRYSGRGNVPYGQGRPERGYTDNGKTGKLAISMAAAANLDPKGEESIYAKARDTSAQFSFIPPPTCCMATRVAASAKSGAALRWA